MQEDLVNSLQSQFRMLQDRLNSIESLVQNIQTQNPIGDWVDEDTAKRLTGLGKSSLYGLRKEGKLTFSKLCKRKVFYRLSDLARLLNENEKA